ncbi:hypothetical protein L911_3855 [Vibrio fluvialis I21563]|uniref:Uncharacterized protein n=1 Tax=Vibrio fluvialis PG41 TaxID=1336752 RepID=S7JKU7_VIBFL|nr:hypothetical protein L910_4461 [Vibrio fluvialis PG41]EPP26703.1 hypothetical protein L911_3855 [Vibrio fluvialis I21563]
MQAACQLFQFNKINELYRLSVSAQLFFYLSDASTWGSLL